MPWAAVGRQVGQRRGRRRRLPTDAPAVAGAVLLLLLQGQEGAHAGAAGREEAQEAGGVQGLVTAGWRAAGSGQRRRSDRAARRTVQRAELRPPAPLPCPALPPVTPVGLEQCPHNTRGRGQAGAAGRAKQGPRAGIMLRRRRCRRRHCRPRLRLAVHWCSRCGRTSTHSPPARQAGRQAGRAFAIKGEGRRCRCAHKRRRSRAPPCRPTHPNFFPRGDVARSDAQEAAGVGGVVLNGDVAAAGAQRRLVHAGKRVVLRQPRQAGRRRRRQLARRVGGVQQHSGASPEAGHRSRAGQRAGQWARRWAGQGRGCGRQGTSRPAPARPRQPTGSSSRARQGPPRT